MSPSYWQIVVLAVIQGLAELLPVSSSAHVIVAERLMRLDPSTPEMVLLLVMLHTGTMFAVLIYFWQRWKNMLGQIGPLLVATAVTGAVGYGLKKLIEETLLKGHEKAEIEQLFKILPLIAAALAAAGVLILLSGLMKEKPTADDRVGFWRGALVGLVQGLCLPFRGFSRSGATISTALLLNVRHAAAEEFSFALAVLLTPAVIVYTLVKDHFNGSWSDFLPQASQQLAPGLLGMACSFVAGLLALRWLSNWLEHGRWKFFGGYCLVFAAVVLGLNYVL